MKVQLHHVHHVSPELLARLDRLLGLLERRDSTMSTQLHELQAAVGRLEQNVSEQTSVMQSAVLLIQGLAEQVREAAAGQDLDEVRQRLTNITATLDSQGDALAAAVAANTPGAEDPAEEPTPDPEPPVGAEPLPQDVPTDPVVSPAPEPSPGPGSEPLTDPVVVPDPFPVTDPAGEVSAPESSVAAPPPGTETSPAPPVSSGELPLPESFGDSSPGSLSRRSGRR